MDKIKTRAISISRSSIEVAKLLNLAPRMVRKWCALLNVRKWGRDYAILPEDIENIKGHAHERPGRPVKI